MTVWHEKDELHSHCAEVMCLFCCDVLNSITNAHKARDIVNAFIRSWSCDATDNENDTNDTDNMMVHANVDP